MLNIQQRNKHLLIGFLMFTCFTGFFNSLPAQDYEWEISRLEKQRLARMEGKDSTWKHLKGHFELGLSYGQAFLAEAAKSQEPEPYILPSRMGAWRFHLNWFPKERLGTDFSIGILTSRDEPPTPNFSSVLGGEEFEAEGSGAGYIPIELGVKYFILKRKFRPYVKVSGGIIIANSRYILVEGNIVDGISRSDSQSRASSWMTGVHSGFNYRLGDRVNLGCELSYSYSGAYGEVLGGYSRFEALGIQTGLSFIF
ncbi:MAG: hypothetical protein MRZ79_01235 [Bacteroidia bacterium]|nr:hypothetical protein [Bacteroidia bacterium]